MGKRALAALWHPSYGLRSMPVLCLIVGVVAGLGAIAFFTMLEGARYLFLDLAAGYRPVGPGGEAPLFGPSATVFRPAVLAILPALGGLISGIIVFTFAPEAEGHGTDSAIDAYHRRGGRVRARVPFIKAISSAITIGTGGSGGREGPIAQIGSGFGSLLAGALGLRPRERRTLMAAGMAAGIGAIFHAPMAGALFAAEVMYRQLDLEFEVILPSVISSIVAYSVFSFHFGWDPLFATPNFSFENPAQLVPYTVLALTCAGGAFLYTKVFYGLRNGFRGLRVPNHIKPMIGGLLTGLVGLALPAALGTGYGVVQQALAHGTPLAEQFGTRGALFLLAVAGGKILTTGFSIGSGGSGGVFGPGVVIGGALGGAVGLILQPLMPWADIRPGAFAMVGMAGFFAAAANTPLSTVIMISEMTGNYRLLVPSMWVCFIAYLAGRRFTLYEAQVASRLQAPVHLRNMMSAVLANIPAGSVLREPLPDTPAVAPETSGRDILASVARYGLSSFPVRNEAGELTGVIHARDLRCIVSSSEPFRDMVVAEDLASRPVTVRTDESLLEAVTRLGAHDVEEIAVVEPDGRYAGMLRMRDIIAAYDRHLNPPTE